MERRNMEKILSWVDLVFLPIMKRMLKQLSKDEPTTILQIAKDQKLLVNAVATDATNPTALQETKAGIRP